jgi:hypothetical protein
MAGKITIVVTSVLIFALLLAGSKEQTHVAVTFLIDL